MKLWTEKPIKKIISSQMTAIIDQGCEFEGKLCFAGAVRIGGIFHGEIYTPDVLVISQGALVHANINAGVIVINGHVQGVLKAKYRVEMYHPAIFRGSLQTASLYVQEGVVFEGSSLMMDLQ